MEKGTFLPDLPQFWQRLGNLGEGERSRKENAIVGHGSATTRPVSVLGGSDLRGSSR